jgi:hypothetical protein
MFATGENLAAIERRAVTMTYNVLIRKCTDSGRADRIACEIARWSGVAADAIRDTIAQRPICIRKRAHENEALRLKLRFEAVGAEVELHALPGTFATPAAEDDGEEGEGGRSISDAEYVQILNKRNDIFVLEKDAGLRNTVVAAMAIGLCVGCWMSTMKVVQVATDFIQKDFTERSARLLGGGVAPLLDDQNKVDKPPKPKQDNFETDRRTLRHNAAKPGSGGNSGGGGDPRVHVTQKGVLGIIAGTITGKAVASADIFGKGGFSEGIDGILQGMGGLKSGGSGGVGRKGAAGIGFGVGYSSGFGGGNGLADVDDLIHGILNDERQVVDIKKRGTLTMAEPRLVNSGGVLPGGRSRASIMRVVLQNLEAIRYAYNRRLHEKPGLKGKITCKFAIDEFGKVIFCDVLESTMSDPSLEGDVVDKIKRWVFEKIDKPGDVTEVVYPFAFSQ